MLASYTAIRMRGICRLPRRGYALNDFSRPYLYALQHQNIHENGLEGVGCFGSHPPVCSKFVQHVNNKHVLELPGGHCQASLFKAEG